MCGDRTERNAIIRGRSFHSKVNMSFGLIPNPGPRQPNQCERYSSAHAAHNQHIGPHLVSSPVYRNLHLHQTRLHFVPVRCGRSVLLNNKKRGQHTLFLFLAYRLTRAVWNLFDCRNRSVSMHLPNNFYSVRSKPVAPKV